MLINLNLIRYNNRKFNIYNNLNYVQYFIYIDFLLHRRKTIYIIIFNKLKNFRIMLMNLN